MITQRGAVLGLVVGAVALAGCSSTPPGGSAPTPSEAPASSVVATTPSGSATPSASASASASPSPSASASSSASSSASGSASPSASASDSAAVKRGSATGDDDVDVLVTLDYRSGKVDPEAPDVRVRQGDRVKLVLTADTAADIVVSGHPDDGADVDPGESEDIDFTVTDAGTTTVTLRQPRVLLATFDTSR